MINEIDIKPGCNRYKFIVKLRHASERNCTNMVDLFASKMYDSFDRCSQLAQEYANTAQMFGKKFDYIAAEAVVYIQNPITGCLHDIRKVYGGYGTGDGYVSKETAINEHILTALLHLINDKQS